MAISNVVCLLLQHECPPADVYVCAQLTLRTLWYATLLVSEVWAGVCGEAPRTNGGVVRVATIIFC